VTPPHAYIAAYLWLREVFGADALVHIGRHGTHEFLPGKNTGSSGDDAAEALLGDVPVPYFYIIDGAAESMTARRRGAATLIGHLTPLLVAGGKQKEFETLRHALEEEERAAKEAPALAGQYRETAQGEVKRLKLDVALDVVAKPWDQVRARVSEYLDEVEESVIPMGLHTIGEAPRAELVQESARELRKTADEKTVEAWVRNLEESPELELRRFVDVLAGRYQPSGPAGDPLRAPAALPSGRALHDFDPSLIPTREACALGRRLGDELLRNLKARDGEYPEKVSLVLWYGETIRHQGAMECQALWLMGVEPRWNSRGVVDELKLIPDEKLGRPRVDVVMSIAGIYRDGFPDKALLLDRASRMVQQAGDNALRRHTQAAAAELEKKGLKREAAEKAAQARVFGPAPGDYGAGISRLVKQGRKSEMVDAYLQHNNHAYGASGWGVTTEGALEAALRGNRAVVHSRSTNLYGVVDNDDFFDYAGGLAAATKAANGGRAVPMVVENLRKRGAEKLTDFRAFLSAELQSRTWNPKWIAEMQRAGYGGAREMADQIENLNGWQATAPEQVDGSFWRKTYDVYVADRHGLGLRKFVAQANPAARRALIGRLLKVEREGGVQFTDAERRAMRAEAATPAQPAPAGAGGGEGARRGAAMAVRRRPVRIFEVPHWAPKLEMTEASVGLTLFGLFLLWSLAAGCGHAAGLRVRRAELVTLRSDARDGK
jgi:cobaltochelatase CobN